MSIAIYAVLPASTVIIAMFSQYANAAESMLVTVEGIEMLTILEHHANAYAGIVVTSFGKSNS